MKRGGIIRRFRYIYFSLVIIYIYNGLVCIYFIVQGDGSLYDGQSNQEPPAVIMMCVAIMFCLVNMSRERKP